MANKNLTTVTEGVANSNTKVICNNNNAVEQVSLLEVIYPIGSIYMSVNSANPKDLFGFGEWERIKGKVIVGVDEDDSNFENSQLSGGSKTVTLEEGNLPAHRHSFIDGSHTFIWGNRSSTVYAQNAVAVAGAPTGNQLCTKQNAYTVTNYTGGNQAHNNLQPYYTAYIWERIS